MVRAWETGYSYIPVNTKIGSDFLEDNIITTENFKH